MYNEFLGMIENYYGLKYKSQVEIKLLIEYFKTKNIYQSEFNNLFKQTVLRHSKKWKTLPDITIFSEILDGPDDIEAIALEQFRLANLKLNSGTSVLCEDVRTQYAIECFGGVSDFCQRDPQFENLHRDRFVKYFIQCPKDYKRRELSGQWRNNLVYIGEPEKCKEIINDEKTQKIENILNNAISYNHEI